MDKTLIRRRFSRASSTYTERADVQRYIAYRMTQLIDRYVPRSSRRNILEVGCGTGLFTRMLLNHTTPARLWLNDICPEMGDKLTDLLNERISFHPGDAESADFPAGQNLIASCSAIQWFASPPHFFNRCVNLLADGGYFTFSTFGKQNLSEIATLTGKSLDYLSVEELKTALAPHYRLIYTSEELIQLSFPSPLHVLKHLKETGVTGISRQAWSKGKLSDFCRRYESTYRCEDNRVKLTYHPIYIIAKKITS